VAEVRFTRPKRPGLNAAFGGERPLKRPEETRGQAELARGTHHLGRSTTCPTYWQRSFAVTGEGWKVGPT